MKNWRDSLTDDQRIIISVCMGTHAPSGSPFVDELTSTLGLLACLLDEYQDFVSTGVDAYLKQNPDIVHDAVKVVMERMENCGD